MGNQQGAMPRERHKSGSQDLIPGSPIRGKWKIFLTQIRKNRTKKKKIVSPSLFLEHRFNCLELIVHYFFFFFHRHFLDGQAFVFDKRPINSNRLTVEDDDSLYSRSLPHENEFPSRVRRQRGEFLFILCKYVTEVMGVRWH